MYSLLSSIHILLIKKEAVYYIVVDAVILYFIVFKFFVINPYKLICLSYGKLCDCNYICNVTFLCSVYMSFENEPKQTSLLRKLVSIDLQKLSFSSSNFILLFLC
jgi:hypothetical protein